VLCLTLGVRQRKTPSARPPVPKGGCLTRILSLGQVRRPRSAATLVERATNGNGSAGAKIESPIASSPRGHVADSTGHEFPIKNTEPGPERRAARGGTCGAAAKGRLPGFLGRTVGGLRRPAGVLRRHPRSRGRRPSGIGGTRPRARGMWLTSKPSDLAHTLPSCPAMAALVTHREASSCLST
jgi:hypothetical protein